MKYQDVIMEGVDSLERYYLLEKDTAYLIKEFQRYAEEEGKGLLVQDMIKVIKSNLWQTCPRMLIKEQYEHFKPYMRFYL